MWLLDEFGCCLQSPGKVVNIEVFSKQSEILHQSLAAVSSFLR
jgi:hypothetical protein